MGQDLKLRPHPRAYKEMPFWVVSGHWESPVKDGGQIAEELACPQVTWENILTQGNFPLGAIFQAFWKI